MCPRSEKNRDQRGPENAQRAVVRGKPGNNDRCAARKPEAAEIELSDEFEPSEGC